MARIGFIGASGLMGHGMAKNLLAKGHSLTITVNRNRDRVADLIVAKLLAQPEGTEAADADASPEDLVEDDAPVAPKARGGKR